MYVSLLPTGAAGAVAVGFGVSRLSASNAKVHHLARPGGRVAAQVVSASVWNSLPVTLAGFAGIVAMLFLVALSAKRARR